MANLKKELSERRLLVSYTIKNDVKNALTEYCEKNELSASRIVEKQIIKFLYSVKY